MKKLLLLLTGLSILLFLGALGYRAKPVIIDFLYRSKCDKPITYKVDFVDKRFNLSDGEVLANVEEASKIWEKVSGKNLFAYSETGPLSINLVFDQRQDLSNQVGRLEQKVGSDKSQLDQSIAEYDRRYKDLEARNRQLNEKIANWNSQGGAPQEEYDKLVREQEQLKKDIDEFNNFAKSINRSADQFNSQVSNLNQKVGQFNEALDVKPEEGVFDPNTNRIEIYFVKTHDELVAVMAHEFGHAVGMGHNQNRKSIMFPSTTSTLLPSGEDLESLQEVCKEKFILEDYYGRFSLLLSKLKYPAN